MLDRHKIWTLYNTGEYSQRRIATTLGISRTTVAKVLAAPAVTETARGTTARADTPTAVPPTVTPARGRPVGRPSKATTLVPLLTQWITTERTAGITLSGREALRRLREQGTRVPDATFYRAWQMARGATAPAPPLLVRFEGVPGEFAQFDFGECPVRLTDGSTPRVHFACYRLKYSRWMYVQIVPDQKVESLVRALLNGFVSAGGVPLRVVFDRPKTVVVGAHEDGRPQWNATLEKVVIDYGFTIELCMPRAGWQKGSVEALVKFVKGDFFTQRRFADVDTDLPAQLLDWLTEVNTVRTSRATKAVPADLLAAEQARMLPPAIDPDRYGLHFPVFVGPTGMVEFRGVRYAMPPEAASRPATLSLFPDRVRLVATRGRQQSYDVTHPRFPTNGISYLPGQRAAQLAKVAGDRGRTYYMRERLLELGELAQHYITERVHARPYVWQGDVETLFALLEQVGDARFGYVLKYAHFKRLFGSEYVARLERTLPETPDAPRVTPPRQHTAIATGSRVILPPEVRDE